MAMVHLDAVSLNYRDGQLSRYRQASARIAEVLSGLTRDEAEGVVSLFLAEARLEDAHHLWIADVGGKLNGGKYV